MHSGPAGFVLAAALLAACASCGKPRDSGPATTYRAVQVAQSDSAAEFTAPSAVAVDGAGLVFVADNSNTVSVLDTTGRMVRRFGRAGSAPGEYRYITGMQMLPGDSLAVFDAASQRLTVYAPDARNVARTLTIGAVRGGRYASALRLVNGAHALLAIAQSTFNSWDDARADEARRQVLRLLNDDGSLQRDSVAVFPPDEAVIVRDHGTVGVTSAPFTRRSIVTIDDAGQIYHGWTDSAAVTIYSPQGRRIGGFAVAHPPAPLTAADVERARQAIPEMGGREKPLRDAISASAPRTWPLYDDLVVDDQERIWIGFNRGWGNPRRWVAFDRGGRRRGEVSLPGDASVRAIRGGKVYAVRTDESDVPRVVVYRLVPEPAKGRPDEA